MSVYGLELVAQGTEAAGAVALKMAAQRNANMSIDYIAVT